MTYTERATDLWAKYGRITKDNRVILDGQYLGRIGKDDQGEPFTFAKGEHRTGYIGVNPIALTALYLMC
jgi:hypothetical protein